MLNFFAVGGYKLGKIIIEGKTKQIYEIPSNPDQCILLSKDRITAGDGVKAHDLEGKAVISTKTCAKVFDLLNQVGKNSFFLIIYHFLYFSFIFNFMYYYITAVLHASFLCFQIFDYI